MADPDFEKRDAAWKAGRQAARDKMHRDDCPEDGGTIFFDDWHDGFSEGEREVGYGN